MTCYACNALLRQCYASSVTTKMLSHTTQTHHLHMNVTHRRKCVCIHENSGQPFHSVAVERPPQSLESVTTKKHPFNPSGTRKAMLRLKRNKSERSLS